jgi:hypothetical protein
VTVRIDSSLARYDSDSAKVLNARSTGHPINLTGLNFKHAVTLLLGMVWNLVVELCNERLPQQLSTYSNANLCCIACAAFTTVQLMRNDSSGMSCRLRTTCLSPSQADEARYRDATSARGLSEITRLVHHHQQIAHRFPELRLTTVNVKMLYSGRIVRFKVVRRVALHTSNIHFAKMRGFATSRCGTLTSSTSGTWTTLDCHYTSALKPKPHVMQRTKVNTRIFGQPQAVKPPASVMA